MKIEEQVLSIEQAKHLQELGLDMSDAALCLCSKKYKQVKDTWGCVSNEDIPYDKRKWKVDLNDCGYKLKNVEYIPTYTLQEVLDKLPKSIEVLSDYGENETAYLRIDWSECAIWYECDDYASYNGELHNMLEGAYDMLCWVLENGYLKEDKK